jgi:hypothetical protein
MATLTNQFLKENKVDNKFQYFVMHEGQECLIQNITDKNIMMKAIHRLGRGNCGRFNTGRTRVINNENATEWYLQNRVIK